MNPLRWAWRKFTSAEEIEQAQEWDRQQRSRISHESQHAYRLGIGNGYTFYADPRDPSQTPIILAYLLGRAKADGANVHPPIV